MISTRSAPTQSAHPAVPPVTSWTIQELWRADRARGGIVRGGALPPELAGRYGPRLEIALRAGRPTIAVNFVSTLDGVVALDRNGQTGGREISGASEPDRFVMGLLRATADAVLVGAGTVRASHTHAWTPRQAHPASAPSYAAWRESLGLPTAGPATVVVSASGRLGPADLGRSDPSVPVIVVTSEAGAERLHAAALPDHVEIIPVGHASAVPISRLVELLGERGFELVLSEGGPALYGELLAAGAVDELFLTMAPQLVGRSDVVPRLGLVEGVGFPPVEAPWGRLLSVMRSTDHLFLRYDLRATGQE